MTTTSTEIHGICKDGFQRVKEAFAANFADHGDVGAALVLVVDSEVVVDIWGGYADAARTRLWEQDTIVNVFSTTKGVVATCANRLIEQGKLDPEAPVAKYWPEFAQAGKETLPVKYILNHQAGLPAVDNIIPRELGFQWAPLVDALAAQKPWWEPGTKHGYHTVTFGHLVGELVRRITGKSVGTYWRTEIAEPAGIDFHIGFGPELDGRCAEVIPAPFQMPDPDHPLGKAFLNPASVTFKSYMITPEPMLNPQYMNTREWRAAEVPAANGHGNARSLARMYGALAADGQLDGFRILHPETVAESTREQSYGPDEVVFYNTRFARGFARSLPEYKLSPGDALFGHGGLGGSFGYADPEARFGFAYTMNKMISSPIDVDPRWPRMFDAVYSSL
jgi:CubicO group peptidase (beta-lactamase class C family)